MKLAVFASKNAKFQQVSKDIIFFAGRRHKIIDFYRSLVLSFNIETKHIFKGIKIYSKWILFESAGHKKHEYENIT